MPKCGAPTTKNRPCRNEGKPEYGGYCHHHQVSVSPSFDHHGADYGMTSSYFDHTPSVKTYSFAQGGGARQLFGGFPVAAPLFDEPEEEEEESNAYDVEDSAEYVRMFAEADAEQQGVVVMLTSETCPGAQGMEPVVDVSPHSSTPGKAEQAWQGLFKTTAKASHILN